jgi:O-antigen ligase
MKSVSARKLVAPVYLLACLLLGGSVQNPYFTAVLQLVGLALLVWAVFDKQGQPITRESRQLVVLATFLLTIVVLQLIPLPAPIWEQLPGREFVLVGLKQLSLAPGWQPISLSPYGTITSALALLPPFGLLAAIISLRAYTRTGLSVAILLGSLLGIALGILQLKDPAERFYLQAEHNSGTASGFFANQNHMASLLLVSLPFLAAILRAALERSDHSPRRDVGAIIGVSAGAVLAIIGLLLNRSLAGLTLALPVCLLSVLIAARLPRWLNHVALAGSVLAVLVFITVLASPLSDSFFTGKAATSVSTRQEFLSTGMKVAGNYFPAGSGIGTFERVYRMHEVVGSVDTTVFVNHAHDDYLELAIETGLLGVFLILAVLVWLALLSYRLAKERADPFALAGAVAAWTLLAHSIVDYPLRTSALATAFAMALGLIVTSTKASSKSGDLRPTRHVEL